MTKNNAHIARNNGILRLNDAYMREDNTNERENNAIYLNRRHFLPTWHPIPSTRTSREQTCSLQKFSLSLANGYLNGYEQLMHYKTELDY